MPKAFVSFAFTALFFSPKILEDPNHFFGLRDGRLTRRYDLTINDIFLVFPF